MMGMSNDGEIMSNAELLNDGDDYRRCEHSYIIKHTTTANEKT